MRKLSAETLDCAIKIHKTLGPGLLESVFQNCLVYELQKRDIPCVKEVSIPVQYDELKFDTGFRADVIVDNKILVEIKSVEKTNPVHKAQVLTYMKLSEFPLGLLINFGEPKLTDGFIRFANGDAANDL